MNESSDDPDAFSVPVLHLSPDMDYGLKESNDYDDDDYQQAKTQPISVNQIVPEIITESPAESATSPQSPAAAHSHRLYYHRPSITAIDDELKIIEDEKLQHASELITSPSSRSSFVKKGSVRHHRSTPNLANMDDESPVQPTDHSALIITSADLNEIKTTTSTLNKNFPSNLELTTNNEHLYDGYGFLNNQTSSADVVESNDLSSRLQMINNNSNSFVGSAMIAAVMGLNGSGPCSVQSGKQRVITQRYKLLVEGDVHVCKLPHSRNVLSKILNSKLLRRWKAHRLVLTETEILSTTVSHFATNMNLGF